MQNVGRGSRASGVESPFCGATLIAPSWLITAAHCLSEIVPQKLLTVGQMFSVEEEMDQTIHAQIGDHVRGLSDGPHEVTRTVEYAIVHPDYRRGYSEHGYDVALLKLDAPVDFSKSVQSVMDFFPSEKLLNSPIILNKVQPLIRMEKCVGKIRISG